MTQEQYKNKEKTFRQEEQRGIGAFWKRFTHRKTKGEVSFDIINIIVVTLLCALMIYPFLYMVSVSLSDYDLVSDVRLLPKGFTTLAYQYIFRLKNVQSGYLNSLLYTTTGVAVSMLLTILCAYPLSKKWLPGKKFFNIFILITMYFGGGLIPSYLLVSGLGMRNTIWAIIIPGALSSYNMIVMRTYFQDSIPAEVEESCQIDGANQYQTLMHIYLPLAKPILATITLFYLVVMWNSWFSASIYLDSSDMYPIQLVLRNAMSTSGSAFLGNSSAALGQLGVNQQVNYLSLNYALTIAVVLPVLVIYPFCQKYFVKGVMVGSLKG